MGAVHHAERRLSVAHELELEPQCDARHAAVAVEGSVESEPYFACVDISDTTKPVGTAKLRKIAPFPASRSVEQPGGEYSLVSSGPFSSHVQTDNGVYPRRLFQKDPSGRCRLRRGIS